MTNNKQQTPHGFCETPEQKCTMNYCDENGCQNRKRTLAEPIEMTDNKEQTAVQLYTEEQVLNTAEAIKNYYENNPDTAQEMVKKHLMNLAPVTKKRTLIIYNTKETTEEEARHLLEILNCDDSTLWDNADHCGVQVLEVPIQGGNK